MSDKIIEKLKSADFIGEDSETFVVVAEAIKEIERLKADRDRWAKWGEHVFICPNKGLNPCRDCVSPATADAMSRVDRGEAWHV